MDRHSKNAEFPRKVKSYFRGISRRLNLPREIKKRVLNDLQTSFHARYEAGESYEEILASSGSAAMVAADLNEQMKEYAFRKSKWRFPFLALTILSGLTLIWELIPAMILHNTLGETESLGIIGGADGPTAIYLTTTFRGWEYFLELGLILVLLIVGIIGFIAFNRCKNKRD